MLLLFDESLVESAEFVREAIAISAPAPAIRTDPIRIAEYVRDGEIPVVGAWRPYLAPAPRSDWTIVFDCYNTGARWYWGPEFVRAHVGNDMQVTTAGMANRAERIRFDWIMYDHERCYILLETFEEFSACAMGPFDPGSDELTALLFDFGTLNPGAHQADIDLRGTGLSYGLPVDRCGGYHLTCAVAVDAGVLTLSPRTQPLYACTWSPIRPGRDRPCACANGGGPFTEADCVSYMIYDACEWIGPTLELSVASAACTCDSDLNCDHVVDIGDLSLFLTQYGEGGCLVADINLVGGVDLSDLTRLLADFGSTCP